MADVKPPILFLSHVNRDKGAAEKLARRIEDAPVARECGLKVWLDKSSLEPGTPWQPQLEDAIKNQSTAFAVYIGASGIINWVGQEVRLAISRATYHPPYPIVPVFAGKTFKVEQLPGFLSQYHGVLNPIENDDELAKLIRTVVGQDDSQKIELVDEPFIGLRPYFESNNRLFFGRDKEVADLVELLRSTKLLLIVGDSGAGKSSLLNAGLVSAYRGGVLADWAQLKPDNSVWHVVATRPRSNAFESLVSDLGSVWQTLDFDASTRGTIADWIRTAEPQKVADALFYETTPDTQILLVIDQFEEIFTLCNRETADSMMKVIEYLTSLECPRTVRIVLAMRRDYYNLCSQFPKFYQRIEFGTPASKYAVRRITGEGLRDCITKPLKLAGVDGCGTLVNRIIDDIGDQPGEVALLQIALHETWECRRQYDNDLLESYIARGGVSGALIKLAEDLFTKRLSPEEQEQARIVFLRLAKTGDSGGASKRIATQDEFTPAMWQNLIQKKLASDKYRRLVAIGGAADHQTVELCHDILISGWPRFHNWLHEESKNGCKRIHDSVIEATKLWITSKRRNDDLLSGSKLVDALDLRSKRNAWLSKDEEAIITQSEYAANMLRIRKRTLLISVAALFVIAAVSAAYSVYTNAAAVAEKKFRNAIEVITKGGGNVGIGTVDDGIKYFVTFHQIPPAPRSPEQMVMGFGETPGEKQRRESGYEAANTAPVIRHTDLNDAPGTVVSVKNSLPSDIAIRAVKEIPDAALILPGGDVTALLPTIGTLTNLRQLGLMNTSFDQNQLSHLNSLPQLRAIDLSYSQLTDAALARLCDLKMLEVVALINTNVGDASIDWLCPLTHLKRISLLGTNVSTSGLKRLRSALPNVEIDFTQILVTGLEDADKFRKALTVADPYSNYTIPAIYEGDLEFDQDYNLISLRLLEGTTRRHFQALRSALRLKSITCEKTIPTEQDCEILRTIPSLQKLAISSSRFTDENLLQISQLNQIKELELDLIDPTVTNAGFVNLLKMTALERLWIRGFVSGTDSFGAEIAECKNLRVLHIERIDLSSAIKSFGRLNQLEHLSLPSCGLTDADVSAIANCAKLKSLDLSNNVKLTDACYAQLSELKNLKWIFLRGTGVSLGGLATSQLLRNRSDRDLLNCLASLRVDAFHQVVEAECACAFDEVLAALCNFKELRRLTIRGETPVSSVAGQFLQQMRQLQKLELSNVNITDATLSFAQGLDDLEELIITGCPGVTDAGLKSFVECKKLAHIEMNRTAAYGPCMKLFHGHPSLKSIQLSNDGFWLENEIEAIREHTPGVSVYGYRVRGEPDEWNDAARELSDPHKIALDTKRAVAFAEVACLRTNYSDWIYLDTLAAANAKDGQFEIAEKWQSQAIKLAGPAASKEMNERLGLYKERQQNVEPLEHLERPPSKRFGGDVQAAPDPIDAPKPDRDSPKPVQDAPKPNIPRPYDE